MPAVGEGADAEASAEVGSSDHHRHNGLPPTYNGITLALVMMGNRGWPSRDAALNREAKKAKPLTTNRSQSIFRGSKQWRSNGVWQQR